MHRVGFDRSEFREEATEMNRGLEIKIKRGKLGALLIGFLATLCLFASTAFASDAREEERVKDAGEVMKEILNIPDDIPQDLLDKAECVVILPSVKKGAFGVGGSYGRGVMVCRSGQHYTGPWERRLCMPWRA